MHTFPTPEPISVLLDVWGGNILIRASDRPTTHVEMEPADAVAVDLAGDTLTVTSPGRRPVGLVLIDVPTGSASGARSPVRSAVPDASASAC